MKKILGLLLVSVMIISLAACGNSNSTSKSSTSAEENTPDTVAEVDFPTNTIEILVPFSAGGGLDLITRYAADALDIDEAVQITQMVGGSTVVCMEEMLNGDQSGHRYMAFHPEAVPVYEVSGVYETPYSEELNWICSYGYDPMCVAVGKDSKINSWEDLVADAQARPGEQTWGGAGNMSTHTVGTVFAMWVGDFTSLYVPYSGAADARTAAIGGNLDVFIGEVSEMAAYAESGDLKILYTMGSERSEFLPDVPTLAEIAGTTENTVYGLHRALVCKKEVPSEVRQCLEDLYKDATTTEEWMTGCRETLHYEPVFTTGAECDEIMLSGLSIAEEAFDYYKSEVEQ